MIRDEELNDLRKALETYFKYAPLGPKHLQLNQSLALKLYDLLNNLDELVVDNIIPRYKMEYFPENELMPYVRSDMARKIADKLIADNYVTFLQKDDPDIPAIRIRASTTLLKR